MNIKSLLLGSAAALAAVSGAQAADAIVAAEPEPMEYVRVCDAFGTGYFYIPGTETCLKIGGYVRFQVDFGQDVNGLNDYDWDAWSRVQLEFTAKSDTELGTLTSVASVRFEANQDSPYGTNGTGVTGLANSTYINEAYIQLGGFRVGRWLNWWDANDLPGELDNLGSNRLESISYTYTGSAFTAGIQVDELSRARGLGGQNVGIEAIIQAAIGPAKLELLGSYDFGAENGAVRAIGSVAVGPGTFYLSGVWSSGENAYYGVLDTGAGEAAVAVAYSFKATDKLEIIPEAQYIWNTQLDGDEFFGDDAWGAGVTVNYQIVENFAAKVAVNYQEIGDDDGFVQGIVRLQRDF
ncbi:Porin omp2a [Neorhizobium galegae bv. officinalis]|uniref:Porin n=1 Tax=Neorhizobium galegae bv. officinalis TaxID=323656 RepID=A0A0T7FDN4_NEOGA|nr:porin [Neorhizobium galegae]CDZ33039.1 Porin omp2a [Neorhizobium galegae bv. officinalis]